MPRTQSDKAKTVTIRLPEYMRTQAARYAEHRDMGLSEFIRYTLQLYIDTTTEDPDADQGEAYEGG